MPLERLTTRIRHPHDPTPSVEDIFASALESTFTDDTQQSHGVPGESIIYASPRFGDVYLQIPGFPGEESGWRLFAHYLWNAGLIAADAIESSSYDDANSNGEAYGIAADGVDDHELVKWNRQFWDMRGADVLELGAATALPSLISTLSNANSVTATDHPSSPAITKSTIENNFKINITNRGSHNGPLSSSTSSTPTPQPYTNTSIPALHHPPITSNTTTHIQGYTWGTTTFYSTDIFGQPATHQPAQHSFDRIVIADCLWMPAQHVNLVKTVLAYLRDDDGETAGTPCVLVVAGFHTGRDVVRRFIEIATGCARGDGEVEGNERIAEGLGDEAHVVGKLRAPEICEVDVNRQWRPWEPERPNETKEEARRWCMCAVLVRR